MSQRSPEGGGARGARGARGGRPDRPQTVLVVTGREQLTPGMVRVRFEAADKEVFAAGFGPSAYTDRYVKMSFPQPDGSDIVRTYTALEPDVEGGTVAIDFVVHGTEGIAGPWAAAVEPGQRIAVRGPGGAYSPDPTADWHLLACDESGLPAVRAALAALPAEAQGYAVVHVPDAAHRQELTAPAGVQVSWVTSTEPGALVDAVRALPWRAGRVHAFVHGEAEAVMHGIRPYLVKERALPRADLSISGYWRRGRTEEGFRAWKQELAAAEG
ncbi:siderophore-interacting protein [Nocardioides sp. BP30]|uniref:siderophore-interacting protein n=1 Tax=Nocardioides sp. BP30 TaxID=3036374 RepID=UPI00246831AF|nr:siderophore-interacting protein [Nocardioides sp. BP30]WGL53321.1 siderophore-interacting protein [Nocardioides sp. BP30]